MDRRPAPALPSWIRRQLPAELQRYTVRVGDVDVHVMERGAGRPVLLLHGNPTWGFLWRKVVAALGEAPLRLVVPDLVGLGLSSRVGASAHTLAAHGAWIRGLIDALALDDLVFVGQDWGGPIGLRALADDPGRLGGLVVLNTVIGPPKEGFRPTAFHRFARMPLVSTLAFRGLGFPQVALSTAQGDPRSIAGDVAAAYRWPLRGLRRNAAPLALARMVPDRMEHPSVPELRRVLGVVEGFEGPTAIVWGDRDPILGRVRGFVERTLPGASVRRTQAGHFLQEEVPEPIAEAIREVALGS